MISDFSVDNKILSYKNVFVKKMKKNLYGILENDQYYFIMDSFGDCFKILKTKNDGICDRKDDITAKKKDDFCEKSKNFLDFTFGILGMPKFFGIKNDIIFVRDNFNRIFEYGINGELKNVSHFENENACDDKIGELKNEIKFC